MVEGHPFDRRQVLLGCRWLRVLGLSADTPPRPVLAFLRQPPVLLTARIALTSAYWLGALAKLADWPSAIAEAGHFGLHPAPVFALLTGVVELLGSVLIIANRYVWLAAGALGVFTGLATLLAHHYWTESGPQRFADYNSFWEHVGLIGAFVLLAASSGSAKPSRDD